MRRLMVAGNWKMHGSKTLVADLITGLREHAADLSECEIAIFPPYVYLDQVSQLLKNSAIAWGAQNIASAESGAYTGEVAGSMLKEFGCKYVIVGHSERRQYYNETNEIVAQKFLMANHAGLKPIICVGETANQREKGETYSIIKDQLKAIFALENNMKLLQNAVIAYEPIWAIGTGKTATPQAAEEVHQYIRKLIAESHSATAEKMTILYGGSVKASNAKNLFSMPNINGGLVGGASLNLTEFMEICQCNF